MSTRLPAVAGHFYSASPQALQAEVDGYRDHSGIPADALAAISPHAGLMYSGHVAGAVYSRLRLTDTVILVGPNHTGQGPVLSLFPEGTWVIPGAEATVDRALVDDLLDRLPQLERDEAAHRHEHCLEVQLPFLLRARPNLRIVPIIVGTANPALCRSLGEALASLLTGRASPGGGATPLVLVTTDMTHYEPDPVARERDRHAIDAIEQLDPARLYEEARRREITMCGLGPTLAALEMARRLHAPRASLIRYATSADAGGGRDRVVGYAGFVIPPREGTA